MSPPTPAMGFGTSFRFGNPFFLAPNVDELMQAVPGEEQLLDRHRRAHHQDRRRVAAHQQRPGVPRLLQGPLHLRQRDRLPALRVAGGARRVRTRTRSAARTASYVTAPAACPAGTTTTGGPLLFYLQSSSPDGIARDAAGASDINNEEFALFIQDKWQVGRGLTLDYGFRWDAQVMPETVDPDDHGLRASPERSAVPVGRHHSESVEAVPAARRVRLGRRAGRQDRSCAAAPASTTPGRTC